MTTPTAPTKTSEAAPRARPSLRFQAWLVRRRILLSRDVALLLIATFCASCARSKPPSEPSAEQESSKTALPKRPLASHIPSAGLRWLVGLKPRKLMANADFREDWQVVFPSERVKAFTQASGADPTKIEEAWIAGYALGELYVFDAATVGEDTEKAFTERALTSQYLESDSANLVHVTGLIENTPHALVHLRGHMVAIAVGDIRLARIVRAYAEGKLTKSPPALEARFLDVHAAFAPGSLIRGFLRGPFEDATDAVAASFVSGAAAVSFEGDKLKMSAQALGVWDVGPELDTQLTRYANELLSTRELRALGWGFPTSAPVVTCRPGEDDLALCTSRGVWDSAGVASALRRITAGTIKEIVDDASPGWRPEATAPFAPPMSEEPAPRDADSSE